jgi:hypothetical protein
MMVQRQIRKQMIDYVGVTDAWQMDKEGERVQTWKRAKKKKRGGKKRELESRKQKHFICQGKKKRVQAESSLCKFHLFAKKTKQTKDASRFLRAVTYTCLT